MGDDRDRNSHGRYDDRIDPATTLDVFDARDDRARPLTASDVVEELGIARRTAHNKLNALVERGVLETRKVGARGRVWWTPIYDAESGRESGETRRAPADDHRDGTTSSTTAPAESAPGEQVRDLLDGLDRPGDGVDYEQRLDAVVTMYEHLRRNPGDRVSKRDFEELLAGEDIGYGGGFDSLWSNWVKANENAGRPENALVALPGVEQRGDDYTYQP